MKKKKKTPEKPYARHQTEGMALKFRILTERDGELLVKIAVASKCKGVRKWDDGLRHRSIGTLVTSAEPRAERIVSLLAFIRYFIVQKERYVNAKDAGKKEMTNSGEGYMRGNIFFVLLFTLRRA